MTERYAGPTVGTRGLVGLPIGTLAGHTVPMVSQRALINFDRIFTIAPEDKVLILADRYLDARVMGLIWDRATALGAQVSAYVREHPGEIEVTDEVKTAVGAATFVASTWHRSTTDPFFRRMRGEQGQRWVKLTYCRSFDALLTPQAEFPLDVISVLLRNTAARCPKDTDTQIRVTDPRGSDLRVDVTAEYLADLLSTSRWRGELGTDRPGCYVHYLPTHGPNIYNRSSRGVQNTDVNGVLVPEWNVGHDEPFDEPIRITFEHNAVVAVEGTSRAAKELAECLPGASLVEIGLGFNPKAPRRTIYPAGSNSPGALHFGLDLPVDAAFLRKRLPLRPEWPNHVDLIDLDGTVTVGDEALVEDGFLCALRDPEVVAAAARFGDPVSLLEEWPE